MEKITRMLMLYSSLMNGEEINKTIFCFENDCSPRSFDRDIEDIRLFLSESFSVLELNYNRKNNTYYIKGAKKQQLEVMEYLFIEKILQDTPVLRNDEFVVLMQHLLMNTRESSKMITPLNKEYILYKPPQHNKALLKINGDLELAIRNQKYIRMVYQDDIGTKHICDVIPCTIRYKLGHLCFIGYIENEAPRMVVTPWFDTEVPFNMAAEVGTHKVISEHSTIGLVVTTDGSITDLPREEYEECEERVIKELQELGKPFAVLMNSVEPDSDEVKELCREMSEKYGTAVMPVNCLELDEEDIRNILTQTLYSFPVREINISMPSWINSLAKGHWLKEAVFGHIRESACHIANLREIKACAEKISGCEYITDSEVSSIDLGTGSAVISVRLNDSLFYQIIGEATGLQIKDENDLMPQILELVKIKEKFSKFSGALEEMEKTGYGIVMPETSELKLEEPEIIKQGGKYGVRLKAAAPAIHMLRTTINTEVAPIVGSEKQSEELIHFMMTDCEENPDKIWDSNIFGQSLHELVSEGLCTNMNKLP